MSISQALINLQNDITAARTAITNKGGTVTVGGGSSQLATDIATIPSGGTTSTIVVTAPTGSTVTLTTPSSIVITGTEYTGVWVFDNLSAIGTYTVNVTKGLKSKTQNVVISAVGVYCLAIVCRVPSNYTEVEYIESTGTQYIDSGIKYSTYGDAQVWEFDIEGQDWVFGTSDNYSGGKFIYVAGWSNPYAVYAQIGGASTEKSTSEYTGVVKHHYKFDINNRVLYIDGALALSNLTPASYTVNRNVTILAMYWVGGQNWSYSTGKLYSFKMYGNGTLIRDFVPCYRNDDSEVGMYDAVNDVFYTNQGTGVFIAGNPV